MGIPSYGLRDSVTGAMLRPTYRAARWRALARPLDVHERQQSQRVAAAMVAVLGIERDEAETQGRRWVLFRREHALHEQLLLDAPPQSLAALVDDIEVEGATNRDRIPMGKGVVFVSLHYGLYASLLPLWLGREAARGRIGRLTVALHSGAQTELGLPEARLASLAAVGLGGETKVSLLNLRDKRPAETLFERLRGGEALLVFPDWKAHVAEEAQPSGPVLEIGRTRLTMSRDAFGLAALAACPIIPLAIHQRGDTHAISFGEAVRMPDRRLSHVIPAAERTLRDLWTETVGRDPAPWAGWQALVAVMTAAT